ncbi:MAG: phenylalanine--tRNA ligase subunit alpha [Patescibacteria group bacterium]
MAGELEKLKQNFQSALKNVEDVSRLEELEQRFFSRKSGELTKLMQQLLELPEGERKAFGQGVNELKKELLELLELKKQELQEKAMGDIATSEAIDVTQPKLPPRERGHIHPLTQAMWDMEDVARSMGFLVEDGPELDSDYYNFTAVNIPPTHPARDSQDTLYIKDHPTWCMRTHVSNMQVRLLQKYGAPLRAAYPGRCFRNEATDARHEHTLEQYECLVVDRNISFADMVGVIKEKLKGFYQKDLALRLRPKYYPFVEPGVNGEVTCILCDGKGCRVCKGTGWLEIFGAGLVHPVVLREAGLDPKKWSGFAFGMGLTRMAMLKYGVDDVRLFKSGDVRFLGQF